MERLLLRVSEVSDALGLGRSKTYELISSGKIKSIRFGRSVRVPVDWLREWLAEQMGEI